MYLPNLKSVALPVPEIIGLYPKIGESLDTPTVTFLESFSWAFARMDPVNVFAEI